MVAENINIPVETPWLACDGQEFRQLICAGLAWLDQHKEQVNALNVFPVPDGDTGTNMWMTMRSAYHHIEQMKEENHAGQMAESVSRGALMGARGNSGVILSQIWRGFAKALHGRESFGAAGLAQALQYAADTAYKGVIEPVEGTILTIIRVSAESANHPTLVHTDLIALLERILYHAKEALAKTPDQLPVLKQAGVVDSGGQGLVYIFEGMLRWARGEMTVGQYQPNLSRPIPIGTAQSLARPNTGHVENPYDVQFILQGRNLNVDEVRYRINAMGDSTVVVGDSETIKVHVHVKDPGMPLSYGVSLGSITDVVVENMQEQMEELIAQSQDHSADEAFAATLPEQIGVVAVSAGNGFANVFRSMGVTKIVDGGQTNNPSTEELLKAINALPTAQVIILPNNKNIVMAAETARGLSHKKVIVIPTRTMPQGVAAMMSYQRDGELEQVALEMRSSADDVTTAEITRAVRDVTLDGVDVKWGQFIGIINGKLRVAEDSLLLMLEQTLRAMKLEDAELLTLYYGAEVSIEDTKEVVAHITTIYPDVEIELIEGGQPHYHYILGAE